MPDPTAVPASVVDRTATGGRVCAVIGPLALHDPEDIDRAFRRVAATGYGNRFGLHPAAARRWRWDPDSATAWSVRREADDFSPDTVDTELTAMMAEQPAEPISIRLKGDYALLNYDHGIGDAQFMFTLPTLLAAAGDTAGAADTAGDSVANWPEVNTRRPLLAALRTAARKDPGRLLAEASSLARNRGKDVDTVPPVKLAHLTAGPTVVSAHSAPGFTSALRAALTGRPSGTFASIALTTIHQLRAHGIELLPTGGAVVDLRRYLPQGTVTLANFMSWVDIPTTPDITAADLHRILHSSLQAHRPLVGFGVGTALGTLRPHIPKWTAWDVATTDRARLAFSDMRGVPAIARYGWARPSTQRVFAVALPLGYRDQISVSSTPLPDETLQLTATFHDDAFDPAAIRRALEAIVSDPAAMGREE